MDIKVLKFDQPCLEALQTLKLQVELHEKSKIDPTHSMKELVDLVDISLHSKSFAVNQALLKLVKLLNDRQKVFFKNLGTDLSKVQPIKEKKLNYRGTKLAVQKQEPGVVENKKKKKVTYRGQDKWV